MEIKIQLGPKANQYFAVLHDDQTWSVEFVDLGKVCREKLLASEAEQMLAARNKQACRKYFPMHGFSS